MVGEETKAGKQLDPSQRSNVGNGGRQTCTPVLVSDDVSGKIIEYWIRK